MQRWRAWRVWLKFFAIAFILVLPLAGCGVPWLVGFDRPQKMDALSPVNGSGDLQEGAMLLPAGDVHLLTVRPTPKDNMAEVVCTEPSPDWATAFGTALGATASANISPSSSGSLNLNSSNTEAITALLGRTAGVVALRDGLYSACQAYANGIIGKDAYALIISQYGNLLVALATTGSSGSGGASSATPGSSTAGATPLGVAVSVNGAGAAPASTPTPKNSSSSGGADNSQLALAEQETIQALVTSCIIDADPTVPGRKQPPPDYAPDLEYEDFPNPLLGNFCPQFFTKILYATSGLLKPPSAQTQQKKATATASVAKSAPVVAGVAAPSTSIADLQKFLLATGDYKGLVTGTDNAATATALTAYVTRLKG